MDTKEDLLDLVSVAVFGAGSGSEEKYLGMGSLISPRLAIMPSIRVQTPGLWDQAPGSFRVVLNPPQQLRKLDESSDSIAVEAFMVAQDNTLNVTLLNLKSPPPFDLSLLKVNASLHLEGKEWRSMRIGYENVPYYRLHGKVSGLTESGGRTLIRLDTTQITKAVAVIGGPVLVGDTLIGMIEGITEDGEGLYAIPISEMAKSEALVKIRKLIADQKEAAPDPPLEAGPAPKTGASPPKRRKQIPGFSSDDTRGEDKLDIKREVEALCSVIAAKDVEPPVSVGLFGDWGSGKSFFMRKMEEQINTLKAQARASSKSPYCPHIVQLWFNAWHYMDTDLWASIASEIFEGLAEQLAREAIPESEQDPKYKRARLVADRASSLNKLELAEKELRQVENELSQNVQSLARLGDEIGPDTSPQALLREGLRFALGQPEVIDQIARGRREFDSKVNEAARKLNIPTTELLELRGVAGRLRAVKLAFVNTKDLTKWLVAVGFLVVSAGIALWLSQMSFGLSDFVARLIAVATGLLGFLSPFIYSGLRAINLIKDAVRTNKVNVENARKAKEDDLLNLQKEIQARRDAARQSVEAARNELKTNDDQLQQLTINRQMADFIRARHQSTDYTRLLGTIARARSDFEKLSDLLASERDINHKPGADRSSQTPLDDPLLPRIDRIVLYIDDLDRCPERKVVEVLQAVHLLLAFPLFVVVVGVDSRWLLHSLKQHSRAFRGLPNDIRSHPEDAHWQSTPLNYLEKIFQIPFTLWPMEQEGFSNLIEALATQQGAQDDNKTEAHEPAAGGKGQDEAEKSRAAAAGGSTSGASTSSATSVNVDPVESVAAQQGGSKGKERTAAKSEKQESQEQPHDLDPEHLVIEEWEREFMKRLYRFIPSPRSAKRFVNIYRILRAWVKDHEVEAFKGDKNGGGHRAALLLLAMLIGHPDEATEILGRLLDVDEDTNWWGFIETIKQEFASHPHAGEKPEKAKDARGDKSQRDEPQTDASQTDASQTDGSQKDESPAAPARWEEFIEKLEKARASTPPLIAEEQSCKDFKTWAPRVARYSFQSGRVLLTQMIDDEADQSTAKKLNIA